jgi:hypothetical protein
MKKLMIGCAMLLVPTTMPAHPFNLRFDTRGECEKAQALVNHFDRDNVAGPVFGLNNNGQAQVFFLESFQCELEPSTGQWRMVDHRGDDSAIGNAWDE